jgi:hypothetical protein
VDDELDPLEETLTPRQQAMHSAYEIIVDAFGMFTQDSSPDGAHYMSEEDNPFVDEGLMCANCVFYEGEGACELVQGEIHPQALCKLWIIEDTLLEKAAYTPPEAVRNAAKQALAWIADGKAGDGFTATGRYRAQTLAAGDSVSLDTIKRMNSFFARHEVDKQGEGWDRGSDKFPSAGRVAWAAWGGDAGWSWAKGILADMQKAKSFGSRSAAGQYAANIRWGKGGGTATNSTQEVVDGLKAGKAVTATTSQVPAITDALLNGNGTENLRLLTVVGTPFFKGDTSRTRDQMPQVPSKEKEKFLGEIESRGLTVTRERVDPATLKPMQADVNGKSSAEIARREGVKGADAFMTTDKLAVVVSSDGYVIDGHHRWAGAALRQMAGHSVRMSIIRIGAPREALLKVVKEWNAKEGIRSLGFGEHRNPARKTTVLAFNKACDLALSAQEEQSNG